MTEYLFDALPTYIHGDHAKDSAELTPLVAAAVRAGDTVTVKGSHSMQMEKIVAAIKALDVTQKHKLAS
jgi:UDP-N-acetylmuramoyl-tripeptide--D-alanyl-D-alanine ligase